jgi:hypothetical protein
MLVVLPVKHCRATEAKVSIYYLVKTHACFEVKIVALDSAALVWEFCWVLTFCCCNCKLFQILKRCPENNGDWNISSNKQRGTSTDQDIPRNIIFNSR